MKLALCLKFTMFTVCNTVATWWPPCRYGVLPRPLSPIRNSIAVTARSPSMCRTRMCSAQDSPYHSPAPDTAPYNPLCSTSSLCLTINRSIGSGETIEYPGTIVVNGNVHDGALISAAGNVIVLGYLEGEVHAGTDGDKRSIIFAWKLMSKHLSIAHDLEGLAVDNAKFGDLASLSDGSRFQTVMNENASVMEKQYRSDRQVPLLKSLFSIDMKTMRMSSRIAYFTGAYIFLIGIALLAFPERLFGIFFDLRRSVKEWIRVGAVLAIVFGVYYIGTAWGETQGFDGAQSFYLSTVIGRMFIFICFTWLVATGSAQFPLFVVGAVNLLGALAMLRALHKPNMS